MSDSIILAFAAFLIALVGTRLVIFRLRKRSAPDIRAIMGKARAPALEGGGFAVMFALVICLLGAQADYTLIFSIFLLAGVAMLQGFCAVPRWAELLAQIIAVAVPIAILKPLFGIGLPPLLDHILAGGLWLLLIRLYTDSENIEGITAIHMVAIGLGLCMIIVLGEQFPDALSTQALILAGAGFGALWWSWPPAKILLGSIGNAPAGLVCGYVLLGAIQAGYGAPAAILSAYIISEGLAPARFRVRASQAQKEPFARYVAGAHMLLVLLAVLSSLDASMALFNVASAYAMIVLFLWFFAYKSGKQLL